MDFKTIADFEKLVARDLEFYDLRQATKYPLYAKGNPTPVVDALEKNTYKITIFDEMSSVIANVGYKSYLHNLCREENYHNYDQLIECQEDFRRDIILLNNYQSQLVEEDKQMFSALLIVLNRYYTIFDSQVIDDKEARRENTTKYLDNIMRVMQAFHRLSLKLKDYFDKLLLDNDKILDVLLKDK